MQSTRKEDRIT